MRSSRLLVCAILTFAVGCSDSPTADLLEPRPHPGFAISDAVHGGGNEHFFWLPPMVGAPAGFNGAFDGSLAPEVRICEWDGGCAVEIARYTTTTGPGSETVRVSPADEHYAVSWRTSDFDVTPGPTYRISVFVDGLELGLADVQLVTNGNEARNITTSELIGLKDGRTLPVRFRIEEGATEVDNQGPITSDVAFSEDPATAGQTVTLTATVDDAATGGRPIAGAEYSLDGINFFAMSAVDGTFDEVSEAVTATIGPFANGVQTVDVRGIDQPGNVGRAQCVDLTVGVFEGPLQWTLEFELTQFQENAIRTVFGFCGRDVWAVGGDHTVFPAADGFILHYDGAAWSVDFAPPEPISGLWGSSSTDVFAGTSDGNIYHYDGQAWSLQASFPNTQWTALWGSSSADVFGVSSFGGEIIHFDGTAWSTQVNPAGVPLIDVWGIDANDVYAVGNFGTILHYDGVVWTQVVDPGIPNVRSLRGVWAAATDDVFVVGDGAPDGQPQNQPRTLLHFDGISWSAQSPPPPQVSTIAWNVWGTSGSNVFAAGHGCSTCEEVLHYDGTGWTSLPSPDAGLNFIVLNFWGPSPRLVWAVGSNGVVGATGRIWRGTP